MADWWKTPILSKDFLTYAHCDLAYAFSSMHRCVFLLTGDDS